MPAVNVSISPAVLNWIVQQPSVDYLNEKFSSLLTEWLSGDATPTFNQVESISKSSGIPLGYFFLRLPPKEDTLLLKFRSINNSDYEEPSRELLNVIHQMETVQDWIKEYRIDNKYEPLSFVGSLKDYFDAEVLSNKIFSDLGINSKWYKEVKDKKEAFKYIRNLLNECGITVMVNGICGGNTHKPLSVKEFRAFALVDNIAPLIFINGADSDSAKLFSLLHEASHIWLGINDLYNDWNQLIISESKVETLCNATAALIIIPNDDFEVEWNKIDDDIFSKISRLANIFHCSTIVVARKAYDIKKISQSQYDNVVKKSKEEFEFLQKNKSNSGGNYYSTMKTRLDSRFISSLCESIMSGRTSYSEAYRLTNTNSKTFRKIANDAGANYV